MVDSSSVLSHILQAFRLAKQWNEQFHLNDASAILGKTGIPPRMSNSFVHGHTVAPSAKICNANEYIPYDLSPSTAWDLLNVVPTPNSEEPPPTERAKYALQSGMVLYVPNGMPLMLTSWTVWRMKPMR
jgi:hypothetical protein